MRISTRLRISSTATTVGLLIMSAILAWTFDEFKRAENDKAVANTILVNFFERTSFRDQYFLHREDRTRIQWDESKRESDRLLEKARLQFHNTEELQTLEQLRGHIDETAPLFHRIVDNHRTLQTISGNKRRVYEELDRRLSSQLLLKAESVRDSATTLYEACSRRVDHEYQRLLIVTSVFALSVATLAILASLSLGNMIRRRLIPLHDGARIIAGGDLSHRIAFDTNDEFADLAQSINRMTDGLHAFTQRLEAEINEHERTEEKLEELNLDFVSFLENTSDFIYFKDKDSHFRFCSQTLANITGHTSWRDMVGKHDLEVFPKDTAQIYYEEELPIFREGIPLLNKVDPYYDAAGNPGWVSTNKWPLFDAEGNVIGLFGISRDITESKQAIDALRESESRFRTLANSAPVLIWMSGLDKLCNWFNKVWLEFTGHSMEQELDNGWTKGVHPEDLQRCLDTYVTAFDARQEFVMEYRLRRHDGEYRWLTDHGTPRFDEQGTFLGYIGSCVDVTESHIEHVQTQFTAQHDPLTHLPNRLLLEDRLQQLLSSAKRDKERAALLFVDLDRFKPINDSHGHDIGDRLLQEVAKRLQACVRESDTVARIGGDEFVILLPMVESPEDAKQVAEKIRAALNQPFNVATLTLHISSSTGVALYPEHGVSNEQLLKNADTAMYWAKESGRNEVMFYQPIMDKQ
ncbi:putative diguanylate cyclase YegE [Ferriphaselus amnicola]|uniref:Putative diguanylate cyclase YegE n=2 Tax=Ferriphaselus amnicola TaxID=1188319 RepID=A0A2Z6GAS2_9PROT|nr:putative diguanylate cyclase YegE [Ferriphaselus amnicola]